MPRGPNGIAAAGFGFDKFPGGIAADFFVGGPQKNNAFVGGEIQLLERAMREEGLHYAGFHVEGTGAVGFACSEPEGHFF
jgi:hypothetical protein